MNIQIDHIEVKVKKIEFETTVFLEDRQITFPMTKDFDILIVNTEKQKKERHE